jgi:sigma-54-interacting transcriptional regulator
MPTVIQFQAPVRCISQGNLLAEGTGEARRDGAAATTAHSLQMLRAEDAWLREVVSRDPRPSVLVQCSGISIASAFEEMAGLCSRTPFIRRLPGALLLPENDPGCLLIGDVSTLMLEQQLDFYDWLDRFGESAQVVSVTSAPLWPIVERGRFLEGLFYRLNVVSLTAGPGNHSALPC